MKDGLRRHGAFAGDAQRGGMLGHATPNPPEDAIAGGQEVTLECLQRAQERYGTLSDEAIRDVARTTRTSSAFVHGVASFYTGLSRSSAVPEPPQRVVRICDGPSCYLLGSPELKNQLRRYAAADASLRVERTSCLGRCDEAPAVAIDGDACSKSNVVLGCQTTPNPVDTVRPPVDDSPTPLTERCQRPRPAPIDDEHYTELRRALRREPLELIDTIEASGLQGRGGAGFLTGRKLRMAALARADSRFVVCNADESEPGTFKDRLLMERDPHLLLEGMALSARAVGAREGKIYIRGEYETAAEVLERAIVEAEAGGILGSADSNPLIDFQSLRAPGCRRVHLW